MIEEEDEALGMKNCIGKNDSDVKMIKQILIAKKKIFFS